MRIGLVSLHTSPLAEPGRGDAGGMNVVVRALGDALAQAGHEVELIARAGADAPDEAVVELPSGAQARFLPAGPRMLAKEELPGVVPAFGRMLAALPSFDVLHAHYWLSGEAALPIARAGGIPLVMSFHTLARTKDAHAQPGQPLEPAVRHDAEARLVAEADAVIVSTASEREAIGRVDAAVIPPGVDTALFHPAPAADPASAPAGGRERRPYLVAAGRIQPLKGQLLAIEALAALPPEARPLLHLAGEPSGREGLAYLARLRAAVDEAGLGGSVLFDGALSRAELAELLRGATALLAPSAAESFGLVALEAAASGVPVIAGRVPGLRDAVLDGKTGLLLPDRDPRGWAAAIARLRDDAALRGALARASVEHAAGFGWARAASRTANLYAGVTGSA